MAKSILQKNKECYLCRRFYNLRTVRGLEEHHILYGRGPWCPAGTGTGRTVRV